MSEKPKHQLFATRIGVIAATVGSAVGLGNIWRFPYEAGVHGGGAFLAIYIVFILILGVPVLCAEFALGRSTHRNVLGCFRQLKPAQPFWRIIGIIGVTSGIMILSFYSVIAGWTLEYFFVSLRGDIAGNSTDELHSMFGAFTTGMRPVIWTIVFLLINYCVIVRGVQKGVERASNVLTPALMVLLAVFCVNSLMMPGAADGLSFLFKPDFSRITPSVVIGAMGQAFFSLSLGLGCMLTYASYFPDRTPLVRSAAVTVGLDVFTAIMAGVLIFPAVFTYGFSPQEGPTLVFEVLPAIFTQVSGGWFWAPLFFFMLFLASLTSTISMSEIGIAWLTQDRGMSRGKACMLVIAIAMVCGVACALSFSYWAGLRLPVIGEFNIFNFFDYTSSNVLLPLGGMLISVFAGWMLDREVLRRQLTTPRNAFSSLASVIAFLLRYVSPVMILVIFIANL